MVPRIRRVNATEQCRVLSVVTNEARIRKCWDPSSERATPPYSLLLFVSLHTASGQVDIKGAVIVWYCSGISLRPVSSLCFISKRIRRV